MKIAVTYENGQVFQHFGQTDTFKIYDVENGNASSGVVVPIKGDKHCALARFLQAQGVDTLICGGIGAGARAALDRAGIALYPGAKGDADAQVSAFLSGSLQYDLETRCSNHHEKGHEQNCHASGCGGNCH